METTNRYRKQLSNCWEDNIDQIYKDAKKKMLGVKKHFHEIKINKFIDLKQKFVSKYLWKRIYNYHVKLDEYFMARKLYPKKLNSLS